MKMDEVIEEINKSMRNSEILDNIKLAAEAAKETFRVCTTGDNPLSKKLSEELAQRAYDYVTFTLDPRMADFV